jgi:glutamate carboxypeptidase
MKKILPLPVRALLSGAREEEPQLLRFLKTLVECESPSHDKAAVDACLDLIAERLEWLDGHVKIHRQKTAGNLLEARFGPHKTAKNGVRRVMLLGHADTVWPVGTLKTMTWRESDGKIYGPGVLDMKAGIAMGVTAIELLLDTGLAATEIVLLISGDEETGSHCSRALIEKTASECDAVLVLEPAQGLAVKTARKGVGHFHLKVEGVAAHAGVDFARGHSAILELARQIERLSAWSDFERGITVNAGVVQGGSASNVVAATATAEIDLRVVKAADGPRMEKRFRALKPFDKYCTLSVEGGMNRPPMERKRGTVRLYQQARALAADLGVALEEAATGGGSDGNFTAALGVATLDGLGAVGEGAHALHEQIVAAELAPRTALLAALIAGIL